MRKVTITIPDEKPMSWNQFYAGQHWSKRKAEVDRVHLLVRAHIDPNTPIFEGLVEIEFRVYFAGRRLDWANIPVKLYEDGLIGWLIKNDSPKYVRGGRVLSLRDKNNPRLEIEIKECVDGLKKG